MILTFNSNSNHNTLYHVDVIASTATPTSSTTSTSQSLFSRLVSAITPAQRTRQRPTKLPSETTPQLVTANYTPRHPFHGERTRTRTPDKRMSKFKTPSGLLRNRPQRDANMSASKIRLTGLPGEREKGIEMKDFSTSSRNRRGGRSSTSFSIDRSNLRCSVVGSVGDDDVIPALELDSQSPISENVTCTCSMHITHSEDHSLDHLRTPGKYYVFDMESNLPLHFSYIIHVHTVYVYSLVPRNQILLLFVVIKTTST